jgi:hypothetical protein
LEWLKDLNFQTPGPPPPPELNFVRDNHQITLQWTDDPEHWTDVRRLDFETEPQPFEGYRIYKSTISKNGPWTLLAEFDLADNAFYNNTGIEHTYTDIGLVNNLEYWYSVTSFSKPDTISNLLSLESSINVNIIEATPGTAPPKSVGKVAVVPNPYRTDVRYDNYKPPWEKGKGGYRWTESDRRLQFINIPGYCKINIYTLAGDLIETIVHNDPDRGYANWNLTSKVSQSIASGIYLFSVEDLKTEAVQKGKFVVIK